MGNLKQLREQATVTQNQMLNTYKTLYPKTKMDKHLLSKIEHGYAEPTSELLEAYLNLCSMALEQIPSKASRTPNRSVATTSKLILQHIGRGKENAITRSELVKLTGMGDRQVRETIGYLKRHNTIVSDSTGRGYYICEDLAELRRYKARETKRAKTSFYRLYAVNRKISELEGAENA